MLVHFTIYSFFKISLKVQSQSKTWNWEATWQKWTALQGFPQASDSGENAIRPRTPGTTASSEPWLLDTAGTDVCSRKQLQIPKSRSAVTHWSLESQQEEYINQIWTIRNVFAAPLMEQTVKPDSIQKTVDLRSSLVFSQQKLSYVITKTLSGSVPSTGSVGTNVTLWHYLFTCDDTDGHILTGCINIYNYSWTETEPCSGTLWSNPSSPPPASWTAYSWLPLATAPGHLTEGRGPR